MNHFSLNLSPSDTLWYTTTMENNHNHHHNQQHQQHRTTFPLFYSQQHHQQQQHHQHSPLSLSSAAANPDEDSDNNSTSNFVNSDTTASSSSHHSHQQQQQQQRDHMFEKPLTPSDVGKLNRLVIPKQHAEKYFPLAGVSSSAAANAAADGVSGGGGGGGGLNLSLATHARSGGAYNATPVGPFTGYASILGRSRFLRPAQELLEDFCRGNGVSFEKEASKLLEDSGSWFGDDEADISRRCNNPTLLSMLHEVYKRYKLYCQQMHSAVTSFESVAGLGNAAPFICFAIKAMFRHFHSLKNAILDHIRVTDKVFGGMDMRRGCTSGSCSEDKGRYEQKQVLDPNFLHHPAWRSQRGFPDKAVSVLRTWLFEHFLHPYPSDSDKQMLAQKTGLSRSQVSNWFTNARVRLWKPMVEEMHALERKTQCSKATDASRFVNLSTDHHFSMHPQLSQENVQVYMLRDEESHCKRSRIDVFPGAEQSKEQFGVPCNQLTSNNQTIDVGGSQTNRVHVSHSSALGSNQETAPGLSWSSPGQIVPFWLAKQ